MFQTPSSGQKIRRDFVVRVESYEQGRAVAESLSSYLGYLSSLPGTLSWENESLGYVDSR